MSRTLIQSLFGLKINKAFPRKYMESESCGNGFYESTGRGNYKHKGVDAEAEIGSEVGNNFRPRCNFY